MSTNIFKPHQYTELIESYRQCLWWNNTNITNKNLNQFMSLYLKCPVNYKKDTRNCHMFTFPNVKLNVKLKHKRDRILRKQFNIVP